MMSQSQFFTTLAQLLGFFHRLFSWGDSVAITEGFNVLDLFIAFVFLEIVIKFAYEAILKRKVNRNEDV